MSRPQFVGNAVSAKHSLPCERKVCRITDRAKLGRALRFRSRSGLTRNRRSEEARQEFQARLREVGRYAMAINRSEFVGI